MDTSKAKAESKSKHTCATDRRDRDHDAGGIELSATDISSVHDQWVLKEKTTMNVVPHSQW